jgi:MFS family permease
VVSVPLTTGFFSIGTVTGLSIFIPLYIELVLGASASAAGLVLIAFMAGATVGSMVAGRYMTRLVRYKLVAILLIPLAIAVLIAFAFLPAHLTVVQVAALLAVGGAGMGPMWPTTTIIIQNAVPLHQLGIATGTLSFFRQLGGAVIVAVFAAIVLGGQEGLTLDKLSGAGGAAAAFAASFRWVFVAAAIFFTITLIALIAIKEQPLRGPTAKPGD